MQGKDERPPTLLEVSVADLDGEVVEAVAEVLGRWSPFGAVVEQYPTRRALAEDGPLDPAASRFVVKVFLEPGAGVENEVRRLREALWYLGRIRPLPDAVVRSVPRDGGSSAAPAFLPLRPGRRLRIVPPGSPPSPAPEHDVILEPGAAFGLGSHPSTRCAVLLLEELLRGGERVLDVGCGSGILALAAARLGASRVIACDVEHAAARSTRDNVRHNALQHRVHAFQGSLDALAVPPARPFDVIAMNIVLPVIVQLLPPALALLHRDGTLALAGILAVQEQECEGALRQLGLGVDRSLACEDWRGFAVRRAPGATPPGAAPAVS